LRGAHHALAPSVVDDTLDDFCAWPVEAIEGNWHLSVELRQGRGELCAELSNTDFGVPSGFFSFLTLSGGTALTKMALATRSLP